MSTQTPSSLTLSRILEGDSPSCDLSERAAQGCLSILFSFGAFLVVDLDFGAIESLPNTIFIGTCKGENAPW